MLTGYLFYTYIHRNDNYVARVDGVGISEEIYYKEINSIKKFYEAAKQPIDDATVSTTVLDSLVDKTLIENYAKDNTISVPNEKVNEAYLARVSSYKDEQAFLDTLNRLYGTSKEDFMNTLSYDILRDSVQSSVNQPLSDWLSKEKQTAKIEIYIK